MPGDGRVPTLLLSERVTSQGRKEKTSFKLCPPLGFDIGESQHFKTHTTLSIFRRNELRPVEQNLLKLSSPLHTIVELEEVETPGFYFSGEMYAKSIQERIMEQGM